MTIFDSIILGIIEGITEFLPISSTAHLMMTSRILGLEQTEFLKSFEIIIQLGALCAVFFLFGKRIIQNSHLWKNIAIAFLPTAIIGLTLYSWIKTHLIGNLSIAVWTLALGGAAFIGIEYFLVKKIKNGQQIELQKSAEQKNPKDRGVKINSPEQISSAQAFIIGLCQAIAIIPGVSRAAATIIPALLFGSSRIAAAEFSFMLALPTVAAAAGLDLLKNFEVVTDPANIPLLIIGFFVSFGAAIGGIKFFLTYISQHSFTTFGIYRIIIAIIFFMFFIR